MAAITVVVEWRRVAGGNDTGSAKKKYEVLHWGFSLWLAKIVLYTHLSHIVLLPFFSLDALKSDFWNNPRASEEFLFGEFRRA